MNQPILRNDTTVSFDCLLKDTESEAVTEALALIDTMYRHENRSETTRSPAPPNTSTEAITSARSSTRYRFKKSAASARLVSPRVVPISP